MTQPLQRLVDGALVDLTEEDAIRYQNDVAAEALRIAQANDEAAARAASRSAVEAKLAALGLTAADLKLLLGQVSPVEG